MPPTIRPVPFAAALSVAALLAGCGAGDPGTTTTSGPVPAASSAPSTPAAATSAGSSAGSPSAQARPGAYLSLADYTADPAARAGTTVVYFFHAPWCPSCRATEESLTSAGVPDGLTVVKVDYDSETALRRTYRITQQHSFVHVAPDGAALKTWTGSVTGAEILATTA